ncbi:translation initiation factor IF-2-like [Macaca thibetana thibetana]|uniref:translation initiation factor IF-2-like n=1 Tax=Macaca thibetana thibetana TaxID=257877 RepID=UPI0021BC4517|nr:translation initiation factor IF-2-like [Macaca thibetana thibetana]
MSAAKLPKRERRGRRRPGGGDQVAPCSPPASMASGSPGAAPICEDSGGQRGGRRVPAKGSSQPRPRRRAAAAPVAPSPPRAAWVLRLGLVEAVPVGTGGRRGARTERASGRCVSSMFKNQSAPHSRLRSQTQRSRAAQSQRRARRLHPERAPSDPPAPARPRRLLCLDVARAAAGRAGRGPWIIRCSSRPSGAESYSEPLSPRPASPRGGSVSAEPRPRASLPPPRPAPRPSRPSHLLWPKRLPGRPGRAPGDGRAALPPPGTRSPFARAAAELGASYQQIAGLRRRPICQNRGAPVVNPSECESAGQTQLV